MWYLLLTFPELFWLVVADQFCVTYQDLLVIKQLMHADTTVPGQGGLFQSVCFP